MFYGTTFIWYTDLIWRQRWFYPTEPRGKPPRSFPSPQLSSYLYVIKCRLSSSNCFGPARWGRLGLLPFCWLVLNLLPHHWLDSSWWILERACSVQPTPGKRTAQCVNLRTLYVCVCAWTATTDNQEFKMEKHFFMQQRNKANVRQLRLYMNLGWCWMIDWFNVSGRRYPQCFMLVLGQDLVVGLQTVPERENEREGAGRGRERKKEMSIFQSLRMKKQESFREQSLSLCPLNVIFYDTKKSPLIIYIRTQQGD